MRESRERRKHGGFIAELIRRILHVCRQSLNVYIVRNSALVVLHRWSINIYSPDVDLNESQDL